MYGFGFGCCLMYGFGCEFGIFYLLRTELMYGFGFGLKNVITLSDSLLMFYSNFIFFDSNKELYLAYILVF